MEYILLSWSREKGKLGYYPTLNSMQLQACSPCDLQSQEEEPRWIGDRVNHDAALAVVDDAWGSERGGRRVPFVPVGTGSL